ncbi:MAG: hypothetical protein M3063_13415 [Actinomycetota bacterium]|nr:hypothetical protein [Actinomycetota bacterium]
MAERDVEERDVGIGPSRPSGAERRAGTADSERVGLALRSMGPETSTGSGEPVTGRLAPAGVLGLQRVAGNRATSGRLAGGPTAQRRVGRNTTMPPSTPPPVTVQRGVFDTLFGKKKVTAGATTGGGGTSTVASTPGTTTGTPVTGTPVPATPAVVTDFEKAVAKATTVTKLRAVYKKASPQERALIWQDAALMTKAKDALSTADWVQMMADLGVYRQGGTVAHATAKTADDKIRDTFKDYVAKAVKDKRAVQGSVAVLDGQDWFDAYYNEFPDEAPRGGPTDDEASTNAFTTTRPPKNVIVLNKDKGNPGTTIHEGMHLYQNDTSLKLGSAFQEGMTEYLTRQVTVPMGIARTNYDDEYEAVVKVVAAVGAEAVSKAYFKGSVKELRAAFVAFRITKGDKKADAAPKWDVLLTAFRDEAWDQVDTLCS